MEDRKSMVRKAIKNKRRSKKKGEAREEKSK